MTVRILSEPFVTRVNIMWRPQSLSALLSFLIFVILAAPASRAEAECKRCGPKTCPTGTTCCNRGCGICAPPGGACIALFCEWGRPNAIDAEDNPTTDIFHRYTAGLSLGDYELRPGGQLRPGGAAPPSASGTTLRLRAQRLLSGHMALRLGASGSSLFRGKDAVGDEAFGWSADLGATYRLPALGKFLGSGLTIDSEVLDGPSIADTLTPGAMGNGRAATIAAGVALEDLMNAVPFSAHARYVQSFVEDAEDRSVIDLGLTFSSQLDWIFWRGGKPFPFGVRLSYGHAREVGDGAFREHEFGGGLYYFGRRKLRLGVDFEASYQHLASELSARKLTTMLRADYYWDANF